MSRARTITVGLLLAVLCSGVGTTFGLTSKSAGQSLVAGRTALRQKHYAEAINLLQDGLKRFPADEKLRTELGRAYLYNRQDDRAMQLFRQVLQKDPSNRPAKLGLARVLGYHRHYEASNQLYRELLQANPNGEAALVGLVRNLVYQRRSAEARRELDQALDRHPDSVRLQRAKVRMEKRLDKPTVKRAGIVK